ncbi:MAG: lamin tail domain-containing protein, partial [Chloroflexi bacterium]|nr:lamin tail domain-containing protein [Chloroflexota bacterium]
MSTFLRMLGQSLLQVLAAVIFSLVARADSTVVFNEIMYHPSRNETGLEWIELHNQMAVNMDLSGWSIEGGIQFTFPEGTVLPGAGYLVLAISPATLAAATGLTNVYGPFQGRLANSGEPLQLRNNNRRLMDAVDYGVEGDWPVAPDGSGVSLAKSNPNSASAPAPNWRASAQIGGTPGKANFPPPSSSVTKSTLVSMETAWRYKDDSPDLGTAWRGTDFDDAPWPSG